MAALLAANTIPNPLEEMRIELARLQRRLANAEAALRQSERENDWLREQLRATTTNNDTFVYDPCLY